MHDFSDDEIRTQALEEIQRLNILPKFAEDRNLIIDGEIHRYCIEGHKNYTKDGAYCLYNDGCPAGWFQDWSQRDFYRKWTIEGRNEEENAYFSSPEYKAKLAKEEKRRAEERKRREAERIQKQKNASKLAQKIFENLPQKEKISHSYLSSKQIQAHGIKINADNQLIIPLYDINGEIKSIQRIGQDGQKIFQAEAPIKGLFFSLGLFELKIAPRLILIAEGFATAAKIYELTRVPCVAAMSCGNLEEVAKSLKEKYKSKIVVMADNDLKKAMEKGYNPGIEAAHELVEKNIAVEMIAPPFTDADSGSDWDDYAIKYGEDSTGVQIMREKIYMLSLNDQELREYKRDKALLSNLNVLNPDIDLPPQEFIGGLFPRGYVSMIIAPPGTGKTMFMQKFVSDLSIGGNILGGFALEESTKKSLIFAGEAGYELLIRRGASMKWDINPQNVKIADQYSYELIDIPLLLDDKEGLENIKRLITKTKSDIVFFDSFMSFHDVDENKSAQLKPILKELSRMARKFNIAIVLNHHSRKRAANERVLSLNQDDAVGTGLFNRYISLMIGIEKIENEMDIDENKEKNLSVNSLKSWFPDFPAFTFKLVENEDGETTFETDLTPTKKTSSRNLVWSYLCKAFTAGEWFNFSQIILSEIGGDVTERQLRRSLAALVKLGKLKQKGQKASTVYCVVKIEAGF